MDEPARRGTDGAWRLSWANADEIAVPFLIAVFLLLAIGSSIAFPVFEAPDEWSHFQYARLLAEGRGLPMQADPERRSHAEGFNPPLYYLVPALILLADAERGREIDVPRYGADWDETVRLMQRETLDRSLVPPRNPAFEWWERGRERNYFQHPEGGPLSDPRLFPVHLMRLFSILCGMVTLLALDRLARETLPGDPAARIVAVGIVALNPQFIFISSSVNSDNLVTAFATLTLWRSMVLLRHGRDGGHHASILGLLLGLGALAKTNMLFLVPIVGAIFWLRRNSTRELLRDLAVVAAWLAGLVGWFFVRNAWVYGDADFLGWKARARLQPDFLADPDGRRRFFMHEFFRTVYDSFWGWFGWFTVRMHGWQYLVYRLVGLVSLASLAGLLVPGLRRRLAAPVALLSSCIALNLLSLIAFNFTFLGHQGRLMFPSIGAVGTLAGVAFAVLTARAGPRPRMIAAVAIVLALFAQVMLVWGGVVRPVYF